MAELKANKSRLDRQSADLTTTAQPRHLEASSSELVRKPCDYKKISEPARKAVLRTFEISPHRNGNAYTQNILAEGPVQPGLHIDRIACAPEAVAVSPKIG